MKKKIFTLCVISFLLSSVFSNVRAIELVKGKVLSPPSFESPIAVTTTRTAEYFFVDCPVDVSFNLSGFIVSNAAAGAINNRKDTIVVYRNGEVLDSIVLGTGGYVELPTNNPSSFDFSYPLKPGSKSGSVTFTFKYIETTTTNVYSIGSFTWKVYEYPTVSTTVDLKGNLQTIYDAFYDRTTQFPGEVSFTVTGGSPDLEYNPYSGAAGHWRKVGGDKTITLKDLEVQNLIPGSTIVLQEPHGCKTGNLATFVVPEESSTSTVPSRPVYLPKVAGATLIPGEGTHFVPSGKSFSFQILPKGDNAGLKPEVTTGERNIPLPEGEEGITYKQIGEDVWEVTILGVQEAINVNVSFPTTQSSTGNAAVDGNRVWGAEGAAYITSATAGSAGIYSSTGALVKTVAYPAGTTTVPLPAGFYIISQGGSNNYKVIVK
ncbi:MAG: hypothetical protein LBP98_06350 [Tannerella sp.]|jgi:hypothetical protein|nr:hypothetical protein [Tannerella sp.]